MSNLSRYLSVAIPDKKRPHDNAELAHPTTGAPSGHNPSSSHPAPSGARPTRRAPTSTVTRGSLSFQDQSKLALQTTKLCIYLTIKNCLPNTEFLLVPFFFWAISDSIQYFLQFQFMHLNICT